MVGCSRVSGLTIQLLHLLAYLAVPRVPRSCGGPALLGYGLLLRPAASAAPEDAANRSSDGTSADRYEIAAYQETTFLAPFGHRKRNFTFGGVSVTIFQEWASGGVAAVVWDAVVVLCKYIAQNPHLFSGKEVLELGAGTGLAGICAAKFGATVTLTDREHALANLKKNVEYNMAGNLRSASADSMTTVAELDWGSTHLQPPFTRHWDIVLGADIVYDGGNRTALQNVLHALDARLVYLACRLRYDKDSDFIQQLAAAGSFEVQLRISDNETGVHLYVLQRSRSPHDEF